MKHFNHHFNRRLQFYSSLYATKMETKQKQLEVNKITEKAFFFLMKGNFYIFSEIRYHACVFSIFT